MVPEDNNNGEKNKPILWQKEADFSEDGVPAIEESSKEAFLTQKIEKSVRRAIRSKEELEIENQQVIAALSDLPPFYREGRQKYAENILQSLRNFCDEVIVIGGQDPEKIKQMLLDEYEKVKATANVTVNLHVSSLFNVLREGKLKHYEEISDRRRDCFMGLKSAYSKTRSEKDQSMGYEKRFIVGCLASENGYDEIIGPAPFYGHVVIAINKDKVQKCARFFEGDSMSVKSSIEDVMPEWMLKKWDRPESRKLDWEGAIFAKALFEVYLKLNNLTHIHNMYVEAHLLDDITVEDFDEIYYGKVDPSNPIHTRALAGQSEVIRQENRCRDEINTEKLQKTLTAIDIINAYQKSNDLPEVDVRELKSRIKTREKKNKIMVTYSNLVSEQLF